MLPGMGGFEILLIAVIALVVVGPKDLPIMLRKLGRITGKVRGMAQEFRNSFDELARQSELDELRKEVEALRAHTVQPLGPELEDHFREIAADLHGLPQASIDPNWTNPVEPEPAASAKPTRKARAKPRAAKATANAAKAPAKPKPAAKSKRAPAKPATKTRGKTQA